MDANLRHFLRIRHLKCDETKPICIRCQKDGQKCDGYNTLQGPLSTKTRGGALSSPGAPSVLPMLPAFDDSLQRELFASFVSCTTDATSLYFGANFLGSSRPSA
jgi:hypothetical protein